MQIIHLNKDNFDKEVLESKVPVLVDLWAPWCGPCKMLGPVLEEVAGETDDFKIAKINCDETPELAQRYGVASIPTLLVFKDGEEVKRSVGFIAKEAVLELMKF